MSGHESYPPPGHGGPTNPPPPGPSVDPATAPPPAWAPPPGMLGAAHKPGALPLRPLGLGDIYDAAFRIIRFNPKATVGSAVLVAAVAMAVPVLVTGVLTWSVGTSFDQTDGDLATADVAGSVGSFVSLFLGFVLQQIGLVLVTGMIAHVTAAAAIGRRLSLAQAWAATRGKRWRLIGLTLLLTLMWMLVIGLYATAWAPIIVFGDTATIVVWGLVTVPLFLCLAAWLWIRFFYLPVPVLMLEDVRIWSAFGRGFQLTRRQFWRTFGIALLTVVIAQIAGSVLTAPISLLGQVAILAAGPEYALLGLVLVQAVTSVVAAAFVAPFTAAVASLQYLDQRMRKEAYDVELMTQAGITAR
jgi:hypothetical protein